MLPSGLKRPLPYFCIAFNPQLPESSCKHSSDGELTNSSQISGNNATNGSASKTAMALIGHTTHSYKRLKFEGGRPALAKKVVADMDSDDELIVQMKQTKHTEKEISDRLKAEGRTVYHSKTIGTRWARLKRVLQERNDELLDAELTDWHEGDVSIFHCSSLLLLTEPG